MKSVSNETYQTLCEALSPCFAVHGTGDCANIGSNALASQPQSLAPQIYCAKVNRVQIPVSGGKHTAIIDEADYPLVAGRAWYEFFTVGHKILYAQDGDGRLMHRVIAGANPGDGFKVDHRDNDGLNNTRENLRIGTQSQNLANQRTQKGTKSGFKGVSPVKGGKWKAELGYKNGRIYIGSYLTKEEAAHAYDAKALELFGPFARLNLPSPALSP